MRVNVGAGRLTFKGWVNCDVQQNPKAPHKLDHLCDARSIPLADGCASEVMALHLIEHFYLWEAPAVLAEWRRLLRPAGKLTLELPNLRKACENVLAGRADQMAMWPLYGDPGHRDPFMCHRWGYTPETITALLQANGFSSVQVLPPKTHGGNPQRDMRVEAIKA